jgi:hypothetical protein
VVGVPPVTGMLNITPSLFAPPWLVIPYNVDPLSVKLPRGLPLAQGPACPKSGAFR